MQLKHLTNKTLLIETKNLAKQYRHVTTSLLHHLREIEKRRLFADLGYSSLFDYAVKELGFSEPSAARRIKAARLLEEIPEIEEKIENGDLNLSNLSKASGVFKEENIKDPKVKKEILKRIENQSARQCEKTLNEFIKPDVEILYPLKLSLREAEFHDYERLKGRLAHHPREEFWGKVFVAALAKITEEKFRTKAARESTSSNPRYVTASLRKTVYERDKVCQQCGGIYALEIDHRKPFALGGETKLENLRLLCRSCNQRARLRAGLGAGTKVK